MDCHHDIFPEPRRRRVLGETRLPCRNWRGHTLFALVMLALLAVLLWPALVGCATVPAFDRQAEVAARIRLALAENPRALDNASPGVLEIARAEGLIK